MICLVAISMNTDIIGWYINSARIKRISSLAHASHADKGALASFYSYSCIWNAFIHIGICLLICISLRLT